MTSGTRFEWSSQLANSFVSGPGVWLLVWVAMAVGAAFYAWVLALAANWAGHRKWPVIRALLLIWAWSHPAMTAVAGAALLMHGTGSATLNRAVIGLGVAGLAWVWVLLTAVKPLSSGAGVQAPAAPAVPADIPVIRFSSRSNGSGGRPTPRSRGRSAGRRTRGAARTTAQRKGRPNRRSARG